MWRWQAASFSIDDALMMVVAVVCVMATGWVGAFSAGQVIAPPAWCCVASMYDMCIQTDVSNEQQAEVT